MNDRTDEVLLYRDHGYSLYQIVQRTGMKLSEVREIIDRNPAPPKGPTGFEQRTCETCGFRELVNEPHEHGRKARTT